MVFVKAFAKKGKVPTEWVEVKLTKNEEDKIDKEVRQKNCRLFTECLRDAGRVLSSGKKAFYTQHAINVAKSLFDKRASHAVFHKEDACRTKFEK